MSTTDEIPKTFSPGVNPDNPRQVKGRDFRLEITAAQLGLPVQQQTLCKLLGINKATLMCWEQAGCPKVQIKRDDQPEGYVRYDIQAVREWMLTFKGSIPKFAPKSAGNASEHFRRNQRRQEMFTTDVDVLKDIAESLRCLVQVASESKEPALKEPAITDEERGLLLVLRLKNPTERAVAKAMGLSDHTSLRRFPAVKEAIRRWKIMKTVTAGEVRHCTGVDEFDD